MSDQPNRNAWQAWTAFVIILILPMATLFYCAAIDLGQNLP